MKNFYRPITSAKDMGLATLGFVEKWDNSGKDEFLCKCCGKNFSAEFTARVHVMCHHIEKDCRFRCTKCKIESVNRYSLTHHMKSAHGVKVTMWELDDRRVEYKAFI